VLPSLPVLERAPDDPGPDSDGEADSPGVRFY
jgi:hypothetical protein